jgi:hypothetical protein
MRIDDDAAKKKRKNATTIFRRFFSGNDVRALLASEVSTASVRCRLLRCSAVQPLLVRVSDAPSAKGSARSQQRER